MLTPEDGRVVSGSDLDAGACERRSTWLSKYCQGPKRRVGGRGVW
jgi:hypothetical protein